MKITTHIDSSLAEAVVDIFSPDSRQALRLHAAVAAAEHPGAAVLVGTRGTDATILDPTDVLRFHTRGKHVYAHTADGQWRIKPRLKDVHHWVEAHPFVQINQSEIVNLRHVTRLDLSLAGTIQLRLSDSTLCYVSRRSLSAVKKALGLTTTERND
ncbi:LytTR family DNA-binding domain-containing protein [Corynebacterium uterequi]|uniref:DNA-binding protein, LytTr n=1 Tax=Corynebacterium uterequi TaxID=1072256 RepID=A0A0G3H9J8_9CORY|nr:LytTR family DNA-binding domain-containing protein [Corynebacterium uterequi]AKK10041.1 DNA-binding protein, LytTr [Corynebacterium uterequi]